MLHFSFTCGKLCFVSSCTVFYSLYVGDVFVFNLSKAYFLVWNLSQYVTHGSSFFAITVYYKNFSLEIFVHAAYLYTLVSIREFTKALYNLSGDLAQNYKTFPVVWGERKTKQLISALVGSALLVVVILGRFFELNAMRYYFVLAVVLLPVFLLLLWRFSGKHQFGLLVQFVRIIILLGVISLPLLRITI